MSNIDKKFLEGDEVIEFSEKRSLWGSLLPIIWFSLTILSSAILFVASYFWKKPFYSLGFIYLLLALPALLIILDNLKTVYAVTNKRVILQRGIFKFKIRSVIYHNISSVQIIDTFLGKYFGFSTVRIIIAGINNDLLWKHSISASRVKSLLENHIADAVKASCPPL